MFHRQRVEVPAQFGKVYHAFQGTSGLVIHVQDLHCNYEVQSNIAGLIDWLAGQHGLRLVGIEGAALPVNLTKLATFPSGTVKRAVGDYFMRQGKMSGAEFIAATGSRGLALEGMENPRQYADARQCVHEFLNEESQGLICDLQDRLEAEKNRLDNPAWQALEKKRRVFRQGGLSLQGYAGFLIQSARAERVGLEGYPALLAYLQKSVGAGVADPERLLDELEQVDRQLRARVYRSERERTLDELSGRVELMERLLNISATPRETAQFRQAPQAFSVRAVLDALGTPDENGEAGELLALDGFLARAGEFYRLADERSRTLADNLIGRMQRGRQDLAVLATGGYHTEGVLAELRRRGVSYLSVRPNLNRTDAVNPYFSLLQNRRTPLEKALAKIQEKFALPPLEAPWADPRVILDETKLDPEQQVAYQVLQMTLVMERARQSAGMQDLTAKQRNALNAYFKAQYPAFNADLPLQEGKMLSWQGVHLAPFSIQGKIYWGAVFPDAQQARLPATPNLLAFPGYKMAFYPEAESKALLASFEKLRLGEPSFAQTFRARAAAALNPVQTRFFSSLLRAAPWLETREVRLAKYGASVLLGVTAGISLSIKLAPWLPAGWAAVPVVLGMGILTTLLSWGVLVSLETGVRQWARAVQVRSSAEAVMARYLSAALAPGKNQEALLGDVLDWALDRTALHQRALSGEAKAAWRAAKLAFLKQAILRLGNRPPAIARALFRDLNREGAWREGAVQAKTLTQNIQDGWAHFFRNRSMGLHGNFRRLLKNNAYFSGHASPETGESLQDLLQNRLSKLTSWNETELYALINQHAAELEDAEKRPAALRQILAQHWIRTQPLILEIRHWVDAVARTQAFSEFPELDQKLLEMAKDDLAVLEAWNRDIHEWVEYTHQRTRLVLAGALVEETLRRMGFVLEAEGFRSGFFDRLQSRPAGAVIQSGRLNGARIRVVQDAPGAVVALNIEKFSAQLKRLLESSLEAGAKNVEIRMSLAANRWVLSLTDDGQSLAGADLDTIAALPFFAPSQSRAIGAEYALTRRMVEYLGGTLALQQKDAGRKTRNLTLALELPLGYAQGGDFAKVAGADRRRQIEATNRRLARAGTEAEVYQALNDLWERGFGFNKYSAFELRQAEPGVWNYMNVRRLGYPGFSTALQPRRLADPDEKYFLLATYLKNPAEQPQIQTLESRLADSRVNYLHLFKDYLFALNAPNWVQDLGVTLGGIPRLGPFLAKSKVIPWVLRFTPASVLQAFNRSTTLLIAEQGKAPLGLVFIMPRRALLPEEEKALVETAQTAAQALARIRASGAPRDDWRVQRSALRSQMRKLWKEITSPGRFHLLLLAGVILARAGSWWFGAPGPDALETWGAALALGIGPKVTGADFRWMPIGALTGALEQWLGPEATITQITWRRDDVAEISVRRGRETLRVFARRNGLAPAEFGVRVQALTGLRQLALRPFGDGHVLMEDAGLTVFEFSKFIRRLIPETRGDPGRESSMLRIFGQLNQQVGLMMAAQSLMGTGDPNGDNMAVRNTLDLGRQIEKKNWNKAFALLERLAAEGLELGNIDFESERRPTANPLYIGVGTRTLLAEFGPWIQERGVRAGFNQGLQRARRAFQETRQTGAWSPEDAAWLEYRLRASGRDVWYETLVSQTRFRKFLGMELLGENFGENAFWQTQGVLQSLTWIGFAALLADWAWGTSGSMGWGSVFLLGGIRGIKEKPLVQPVAPVVSVPSDQKRREQPGESGSQPQTPEKEKPAPGEPGKGQYVNIVVGVLLLLVPLLLFDPAPALAAMAKQTLPEAASGLGWGNLLGWMSGLGLFGVAAALGPMITRGSEGRRNLMALLADHYQLGPDTYRHILAKFKNNTDLVFSLLLPLDQALKELEASGVVYTLEQKQRLVKATLLHDVFFLPKVSQNLTPVFKAHPDPNVKIIAIDFKPQNLSALSEAERARLIVLDHHEDGAPFLKTAFSEALAAYDPEDDGSGDPDQKSRHLNLKAALDAAADAGHGAVLVINHTDADSILPMALLMGWLVHPEQKNQARDTAQYCDSLVGNFEDRQALAHHAILGIKAKSDPAGHKLPAREFKKMIMQIPTLLAHPERYSDFYSNFFETHERELLALNDLKMFKVKSGKLSASEAWREDALTLVDGRILYVPEVRQGLGWRNFTIEAVLAFVRVAHPSIQWVAIQRNSRFMNRLVLTSVDGQLIAPAWNLKRFFKGNGSLTARANFISGALTEPALLADLLKELAQQTKDAGAEPDLLERADTEEPAELVSGSWRQVWQKSWMHLKLLGIDGLSRFWPYESGVIVFFWGLAFLIMPWQVAALFAGWLGWLYLSEIVGLGALIDQGIARAGAAWNHALSQAGEALLRTANAWAGSNRVAAWLSGLPAFLAKAASGAQVSPEYFLAQRTFRRYVGLVLWGRRPLRSIFDEVAERLHRQMGPWYSEDAADEALVRLKDEYFPKWLRRHSQLRLMLEQMLWSQAQKYIKRLWSMSTQGGSAVWEARTFNSLLSLDAMEKIGDPGRIPDLIQLARDGLGMHSRTLDLKQRVEAYRRALQGENPAEIETAHRRLQDVREAVRRWVDMEVMLTRVIARLALAPGASVEQHKAANEFLIATLLDTTAAEGYYWVREQVAYRLKDFDNPATRQALKRAAGMAVDPVTVFMNEIESANPAAVSLELACSESLAYFERERVRRQVSDKQQIEGYLQSADFEAKPFRVQHLAGMLDALVDPKVGKELRIKLLLRLSAVVRDEFAEAANFLLPALEELSLGRAQRVFRGPAERIVEDFKVRNAARLAYLRITLAVFKLRLQGQNLPIGREYYAAWRALSQNTQGTIADRDMFNVFRFLRFSRHVHGVLRNLHQLGKFNQLDELLADPTLKNAMVVFSGGSAVESMGGFAGAVVKSPLTYVIGVDDNGGGSGLGRGRSLGAWRVDTPGAGDHVRAGGTMARHELGALGGILEQLLAERFGPEAQPGHLAEELKQRWSEYAALGRTRGLKAADLEKLEAFFLSARMLAEIVDERKLPLALNSIRNLLRDGLMLRTRGVDEDFVNPDGILSAFVGFSELLGIESLALPASFFGNQIVTRDLMGREWIGQSFFSHTPHAPPFSVKRGAFRAYRSVSVGNFFPAIPVPSPASAAVSRAKVIIGGMCSMMTSLAPLLKNRDLSEALAKNPSAQRVYVVNPVLDEESLGMTFEDTLRVMETASGLRLPKLWNALVADVQHDPAAWLVPDQPHLGTYGEMYQASAWGFRGPSVIPGPVKGRLRAEGITVVENPISEIEEAQNRAQPEQNQMVIRYQSEVLAAAIGRTLPTAQRDLMANPGIWWLSKAKAAQAEAALRREGLTWASVGIDSLHDLYFFPKLSEALQRWVEDGEPPSFVLPRRGGETAFQTTWRHAAEEVRQGLPAGPWVDGSERLRGEALRLGEPLPWGGVRDKQGKVYPLDLLVVEPSEFNLANPWDRLGSIRLQDGRLQIRLPYEAGLVGLTPLERSQAIQTALRFQLSKIAAMLASELSPEESLAPAQAEAMHARALQSLAAFTGHIPETDSLLNQLAVGIPYIQACRAQLRQGNALLISHDMDGTVTNPNAVMPEADALHYGANDPWAPKAALTAKGFSGVAKQLVATQKRLQSVLRLLSVWSGENGLPLSTTQLLGTVSGNVIEQLDPASETYAAVLHKTMDALTSGFLEIGLRMTMPKTDHPVQGDQIILRAPSLDVRTRELKGYAGITGSAPGLKADKAQRARFDPDGVKRQQQLAQIRLLLKNPGSLFRQLAALKDQAQPADAWSVRVRLENGEEAQMPVPSEQVPRIIEVLQRMEDQMDLEQSSGPVGPISSSGQSGGKTSTDLFFSGKDQGIQHLLEAFASSRRISPDQVRTIFLGDETMQKSIQLPDGNLGIAEGNDLPVALAALLDPRIVAVFQTGVIGEGAVVPEHVISAQPFSNHGLTPEEVNRMLAWERLSRQQGPASAMDSSLIADVQAAGIDPARFGARDFSSLNEAQAREVRAAWKNTRRPGQTGSIDAGLLGFLSGSLGLAVLGMSAFAWLAGAAALAPAALAMGLGAAALAAGVLLVQATARPSSLSVAPSTQGGVLAPQAPVRALEAWLQAGSPEANQAYFQKFSGQTGNGLGTFASFLSAASGVLGLGWRLAERVSGVARWFGQSEILRGFNERDPRLLQWMRSQSLPDEDVAAAFMQRFGRALPAVRIRPFSEHRAKATWAERWAGAAYVATLGETAVLYLPDRSLFEVLNSPDAARQDNGLGALARAAVSRHDREQRARLLEEALAPATLALPAARPAGVSWLMRLGAFYWGAGVRQWLRQKDPAGFLKQAPGFKGAPGLAASIRDGSSPLGQAYLRWALLPGENSEMHFAAALLASGNRTEALQLLSDLSSDLGAGARVEAGTWIASPSRPASHFWVPAWLLNTPGLWRKVLRQGEGLIRFNQEQLPRLAPEPKRSLLEAA